jgi:hypothetical protein
MPSKLDERLYFKIGMDQAECTPDSREGKKRRFFLLSKTIRNVHHDLEVVMLQMSHSADFRHFFILGYFEDSCESGSLLFND